MLELRAITKTFPGVRALFEVSLQFEAGTIHGLVGENGAGKSTLLKIVTGIDRADSGEIHLDRELLRLSDPHAALLRGIAMVQQEIQLVPESSIAENVMLDKLPTRGRTGIIDWPSLERCARTFAERVGLHLPLETPVRRLSAAQKQLVQIAKALAAKARVLLLDEPTSSLTEHEARALAQILLRLKAEGVAVIYVSHKLDEVFHLCDRISVLRDGHCVGSHPVAELTRERLVQLMIGRATADARHGTLKPDRSCEALRADRLTRHGHAQEISFTLYPGEILGFYGLVGSGRTETARMLIGDTPPDSGQIFVKGRPATIRSVHRSLHRFGIGYVSENRKEEGLLLDSSVGTNITLTIWQRLRHRLTRRICPTAERTAALEMVRAVDIRCNGLHQTTGSLSGGNQQKICLAKWLVADCDTLIIDEPTVGVDVGAKEQIHRLIWELAGKQNKAIILISSDLPEMISLAHRILVFRDRRVVGEIGEVDTPGRTYEEISGAIGRLLN